MKLVVAIDGPECAATALQYILKGRYDSSTYIYLLHVIVPGFADVPVAGIPDVVENERKEEQGVLNDMARALRSMLGAKVATDILQGEIADVIAEMCTRVGADEAIVPSHARHGFARLWFGSVADEIVDAAPCTVVVLKMPPKGHDLEQQSEHHESMMFRN
jgi:nucleotide-binding universal stress UspA family protein